MDKYLIKEKIIPALFGAFGIFILANFFKFTTGNVILFASLGASTVILTEFPDTQTAHLRVVIFSYLISSIVGFSCSFIPHIPLAAFLGIFISISLMMLTKNPHPPAGGICLAFIFYSRGIVEVMYVMIMIIFLLIILKSIVYFYKKEFNIRKFHHEFYKENPLKKKN